VNTLLRSSLAVAFVALVVGIAGGTGSGRLSLPPLAPPIGPTLEAAQGQVRAFAVVARRYSFSPDRLEVDLDDLVKITFDAQDMPHSFTLDEYRISKRARPGQPVVFEFRADRPGRFTFYCNLANDDGCRQMRGELIVRGR
jgi:heme/copper-type cytochrome/quinol oxidase subunit 2